MSRVILLLITTLFFKPAYSWYDSGHMISSWIAWQHMTPAARQKSQELLDVLQDAAPKTRSFMIASTWMDSIKKEGLAVTRYWHTVSEDQVIHGLAAGPEKQNSIWVAQEAIKTLSNPSSSVFAQAFMLRALIHISQDLHSPLQICDDRKNRPPEHEKCYIAFKISPIAYQEEQLTNIAALWDSGLASFPPVRSNDPNAEKIISKFASQLSQKLTSQSQSKLKELDPEIWARESLNIQKTFAMNQIKPGAPLSKNYLLRGQSIAEERIVISGYRLAEVLNQAFSQ